MNYRNVISDVSEYKAYLGFEGRYAPGLIRHMSWRVVEVRIHTLPSSKLA